jgi:hypothetical protein
MISFKVAVALRYAEMTGELAVRLTINVAVVLYAAADVYMRCIPRAAWTSAPPITNRVRLLWSGACLVYCSHVALAFHYFHHWSHVEAMRNVEEQSGSGWGIFVSYFFTLLWITDVFWWWRSPVSYLRRPRAVGFAVHAFMAFIIFNGAVIFAAGPVRWLGILVFTILGLVTLRAIAGH